MIVIWPLSFAAGHPRVFMQLYTIHAERHTVSSSSRPNLRKRVMPGGGMGRQHRGLLLTAGSCLHV